MTGGERRALRIKQLEGWRSSGLSAGAYCKGEGISLETFRRWRRKLGEQANALPATMRFVPVRVAETISTPPQRARHGATDVLAQPLEVVLASGRRLRFEGGVDETALARLVRLLELLPC